MATQRAERSLHALVAGCSNCAGIQNYQQQSLNYCKVSELLFCGFMVSSESLVVCEVLLQQDKKGSRRTATRRSDSVSQCCKKMRTIETTAYQVIFIFILTSVCHTRERREVSTKSAVGTTVECKPNHGATLLMQQFICPSPFSSARYN